MKRICAALLASLMLALCACSNSEINTENSDAAAANDLSASEPETFCLSNCSASDSRSFFVSFLSAIPVLLSDLTVPFDLILICR